MEWFKRSERKYLFNEKKQNKTNKNNNNNNNKNPLKI